jgi:hypothetical protein
MANLFALAPVTFPGRNNKLTFFVVDADSRLQRVRECTDANALRQALDVPGLQKAVRKAIEAKLRKMDREVKP